MILIILNGMLHFDFLASYFSYYIFDYYNDVLNNNDIIDEFIQKSIAVTINLFKENFQNACKRTSINEDTDEYLDILFQFSNGRHEDGEIILSHYFDDLTYTIQLIRKNKYSSLTYTDKKKLKACKIYAQTLSETALKANNIFADNMWNITNIFLYQKLLQKDIPDKPHICINKTNDMKPYYYSMSLCSSATIGSEINDISEGAFFGNIFLENISLEDGSAEIIQKSAFENTALKSLSLPLSTRYIGERAFSNCNLQTLIVPPTVELIDEQAFLNCNNLKTVFIMNKNTMISQTAFEGCASTLSIHVFDEIQSHNIEASEKNKGQTMDVVFPAYLIKNNLYSCSICQEEYQNKECLIKYNELFIKTSLLYCNNCNSYCVNSNIIETKKLKNICSTSPISSKTNVVNKINIQDMTALPMLPKEIVVNDKKTGRKCISYQLLSFDDEIVVENNPAFDSMINQVIINGEPVELPYVLSAGELKSIHTEKRELYPIKLDCKHDGIIITCDGIPLSDMQLVEKGKTVEVSADNTTDEPEYCIISVTVDSKEVTLPYHFIIENKAVISAQYSVPIYVYADKKLTLSANDCDIVKCLYDSYEINKFRLSKPSIITVTSFSGGSPTITYLDCQYKLPAKLKIDHTSYISVQQSCIYYNLKISSPFISVYRKGQMMRSGSRIKKGDTLSVNLVNKSTNDSLVLNNGVVITVPHTILVTDSDINLELVPKNNTKISNPIVSSSHSGNDLQLNSSSFLGDMGYSTSLGTSRRYEILQKAVRIYGKKKVISFLEYLIRGKLAQINGEKKYENAISIWRYDIQRVKNM